MALLAVHTGRFMRQVFETGFLASREKRRKGFSHAFPEMLVDVQFEQSPAVAPLHSDPKIAKMGSGPRARMASAV